MTNYFTGSNVFSVVWFNYVFSVVYLNDEYFV